MAKAYSEDLRRKVIKAIEMDGLKKQEASELFGISRNTINLWFKLKSETGDIQPRQRQIAKPTGKITDWDKFRTFVAEHGDKTQAEMATLWEDGVSQRTISRALHKIGYSRKKKRMATANGMKRNGKRF
jgi:transposase